MNDIYFIADAHLSYDDNETEKKKRQKLRDFLEYLAADGKASELYILGDLFDFWFEWYHVIPKYWFPVLYRFRRLIDSGITVKFVTGNHDFYTGQYLENEIGVRCFNEQHEFTKDAKRFFVAHGDGCAREDRGYRLLKKVIRNRVSIFLYRTFISPDLGMKIARWASKSSRRRAKIKKHGWAEEYYAFAREKFDQGYDYVVLGHIHFPMIRTDENSGKTYVNCGDWISQFTYAQYDGSRLMLKQWDRDR